MKELIIKKIKPMFTAIVTTMDKYTEDSFTEGGIIDPTKAHGCIKDIQKVLAIGTCVRDIKEGDIVNINPIRYAVRKNDNNSIKNDIEGGNPTVGYSFDTIELDGKQCLLLQDRDINYIIEEYEYKPLAPAKKLVVPKKKKLIL